MKLKSGTVKLPPFSSSPIIITPLLGYIASMNVTSTILILLSLPICLCIAHDRFPGSKFFYIWTLMSICDVFFIFQFILLPTRTISSAEIIIFFALFISCSCLIKKMRNAHFYYINTKTSDLESGAALITNVREPSLHHSVCSVCKKRISSRTYHCSVCNFCIPQKDLHCSWFDCCIGVYNRRTYFAALFFIFAFLLFSGYLMLTVACHPVIAYDLFLFPDDCTGVYSHSTSAICFVCGLYCSGISMMPLVLIIHEIWMISFGLTGHEWRTLHHKRRLFCCHNTGKKHDKGVIRNWLYFISNRY